MHSSVTHRAATQVQADKKKGKAYDQPNIFTPAVQYTGTNLNLTLF